MEPKADNITFSSISKAIIKDSTDIFMTVAVIGIVIAMIIPIPPFFLDFFLAINITCAITILIIVMWAKSALDLSIFPSVLLILTLFRLALNISTTRLILLRGHEGANAAGTVIMSFGNFVVGGNYVVGMIIFIILVIVNFIVITKGAGRIAEVSARFILDAIPGKQMAIDADLNAGLINEVEAKDRRKAIAKESEFHGAMDGASKFVKGDAIAGIIITFINIIAGFVIGVIQQQMTMGDALSTYTLLTVGDGLVSQIPALVISTASGILVSKVGNEDKMGKDIAKHLFAKSSPIYTGLIIVFLLGLVPGLPAVPFIGLASVLAIAFYYLKKTKFIDSEEDTEDKEGAAGEAGESDEEEDLEKFLNIDIMEIEVGYSLVPLVDKSQDGSLLRRIKSLRKQFAVDVGILIPPIHIRDNLNLGNSDYKIMIRGMQAAQGDIMMNHLLAMDMTGDAKKIEGIPFKEPAFGFSSLWIPLEKEEEAKMANYTVVDGATVVATHLSEIIKNNAHQLLGRQEVQKLLDNLSKSYPKIVEELIPSLLPLGSVQKVLQNLLRENVPIKDLLSIVETLTDYSLKTKDPDVLTEYVRQKVSGLMLKKFINEDNELGIIGVDPSLEENLMKSVKRNESGTYFSPEPKFFENIIKSMKEQIQKIIEKDIQPIILCSVNLRKHIKEIVNQIDPSTVVISHHEVPNNINVKQIGKISVTD